MQGTETQPDTIMVVEDEGAISDMVAEALEDQGYRVLTAQDGQEARQMVQCAPPDAIVLDLRLPRVDGWQFIHWCRTDPTTATIPIIITSAASEAQQDGEVQSLVFLEKPFDLDVLLVLVEDAVSLAA